MPSPASRRSRSRGSRRSPRPYHHGDLPRALVEGAVALLRERGAAALTLRAAARRAGVSQAAPYRHFADKEALLAAVAEEGFRALERATADAARRTIGDPLARLEAMGGAYVRFAAQHPDHYRVMFGSEVRDRSAHPALRTAAQHAFRAIAETIADGQRARHLRQGDVEELARAAWALVHGLAQLAIDGQIPLSPRSSGLDAAAQSATRLLVDGLRARGAPRAGLGPRARSSRRRLSR